MKCQGHDIPEFGCTDCWSSLLMQASQDHPELCCCVICAMRWRDRAQEAEHALNRIRGMCEAGPTMSEWTAKIHAIVLSHWGQAVNSEEGD